jgi:tetratricopeptide (TPR) repeat protein
MLSRSTSKSLQQWLPGILLLGLPALVYLPSLGNGFVWDDHGLIFQDPWVQSLEHMGFLFSPEYWNQYFIGIKGQYRPLRALSLALQLAIWGPDPKAFHAFNLILHLLNTWLLSRVLKRLGFPQWVAWLAALVFAMHPVHTEVVVWVKNRTEEMGMLFSLLGILCYLKAQGGGARRAQLSWWGLCSLCCAMALLSKETALVLPILLFAHAFLLAPHRARALLAAGASLIPLGLYLFVKLRLLSSEGSAFAPALPLLVHAGLVANTIGTYLRLLILPLDLNADRPLELAALAGSWETWAGMGAILICGAFGLWLLLNKRPLTLYGLVWLFIGLAPVSNIQFLVTRPLADQRLYFPSVGFCLLVALALQAARASSNRPGWLSPSATAASVLLVGLYGAQVISRTPVWRDDQSLIRDTLKRSPNSTRPHVQMALQLVKRGDLDEAARELLRTLELSPGLAEAHNLLGVIFTEKKDYQRAIHHFQKAIQIRPSSPDSMANMAIPLVEVGRVEEAQSTLQRALEMAPKDPQILTHLGIANGRMGRYKEAIEALQRALEIQPKNLKARVFLSYAYAELGDLDRCIQELTQALSENPESIGLRIDLSTAYRKKAQPQMARQILEEALSMAPSDPRVHTALGNLAASHGNWDEAVAAFQEAARLASHQAVVQYNLGMALLDAGRAQEAERPLRMAVEIEPNNAAFLQALVRALRALGKEGEAEKHENTLRGLPQPSAQRSGSGGP